MRILVIHIAIYLAFYVLAAYATTDILRLLKGCTIAVNAPDCYCPVCHQKIALRDQLPIISYLKNHGTCRNCKSPIPVADLFLEIFLFLLLSMVSCALHFSWISYGICISFYEGTKAIFLLRSGARTDSFQKNLAISLSINMLLFTFLAFLFALEHVASSLP